MKNKYLMPETGRFSVANAEIFDGKAAAAAGELAEVLSSFDAAAAKIAVDKNLSPEGRRAALAERAGRVRALMDERRVKLADLERHESAERARMLASLKSEGFTTGNQLDDAVRAAELRAHVRGLDPLLREAAYARAVASGDAELVQVIENAPAALALVAPDFVAEQRAKRAARLAPEPAALAEDLRTLAVTMRTQLTMAEKHIESAL